MEREAGGEVMEWDVGEKGQKGGPLKDVGSVEVPTPSLLTMLL